MPGIKTLNSATWPVSRPLHPQQRSNSLMSNLWGKSSCQMYHFSKFPPSMAVSTLCSVASVISSEGIVPLVSVYIFLHGIDGPLYRAYPEYLPVTAISETNRKRTEVFCLKKEKEKKKRLYTRFSRRVSWECIQFHFDTVCRLERRFLDTHRTQCCMSR